MEWVLSCTEWVLSCAEWVLPCTEWVPSRLASVLPEKIA
jgi:hypothetical protein